MLPVAAPAMDYNGEFQAGYQEIDGISLGYLQINGTRMFALTQVLGDLLKDIPRATVSKKMESLHIQSRRCDLKELRTLKAIQSVPLRAVKCSLISKADLEALRASCKASAPRRRRRKRRKRKSKRRAAGDPFERPRLLPAYAAPDGAFRAGGNAALSAKRDAFAGAPPFARDCEKTAPPVQAFRRSGREQLLAGVLSAYPGGLQRLHSAVRAHGAAPPPAKQPDAGRPKRSPCGCLAKKAARPPAFAGAKRQGTSAGYSSDSDSSGASSPASSSESSDDDDEEEEEEEDDEEEDSSSSSEEGSSSGSESSSLCSGDSVQSTRYRQAALPRLPPAAQAAQAALLPGVAKALRPDPANLLFWARTLRASSALESFKPAPVGAAKEPEVGVQREPRRPPEPPARPRSPVEPPPQPPPGQRAFPEEEGADSPGPREALPVGGPPDKAEGAAAAAALSQGGPSQEGPGGRETQFDRLIRQSKLWCYAKGFNVDGKGLRRAEQAKGGSSAPSKAGLLALAPKPPRGGHDLESGAKRSRRAERERQAKGRPPKNRGKARSRKGPGPPCKRLLGAGPAPVRPPFTLMGTFPCTPALVVGSDGDLCPASSLCVKDSGALSKTHPLWTWQLGGNAIPVPPSLKFRGYGLEDL